MPYTAKRYQTENGEIPYTDWMKKIKTQRPGRSVKGGFQNCPRYERKFRRS